MAVLKCKMCGGDLNVEESKTVAICGYCGTQQTLPRLDDERRIRMFDRANHFRRNSEYDKAAALFEEILNEDNTDAEAYWSLVLCKYGVEYVKDPATHRRFPTVNRTQFTSIYNDENYRSALKYANPMQTEVYHREAKAINDIQKAALAISQNEEPFDVFICYKESDENGRRTPDSVIGYDLYQQLTDRGYKVFFARVTLEDKLGTDYEPYIFSALNSAKVMVVLGTKPEYFNAVWVKNEWSRFLGLIKNGEKKTLIPAYKDMDPYTLPDAFAHLQAQDMSKLGFMQDLVRGIGKIIGDAQPNNYYMPQSEFTPVYRVDEKERRANGLPIIRNVCSICSNDPDNCWPKGQYTPYINMDYHSVIHFHLSLDNRYLTSKRVIKSGWKIFNDNDCEVFDDVSELAWRSDYDRISKGWIVRGSDGTFVPTGKYRAEFWVENSAVFEYYFTVTSDRF